MAVTIDRTRLNRVVEINVRDGSVAPREKDELAAIRTRE